MTLIGVLVPPFPLEKRMHNSRMERSSGRMPFGVFLLVALTKYARTLDIEPPYCSDALCVLDVVKGY